VAGATERIGEMLVAADSKLLLRTAYRTYMYDKYAQQPVHESDRNNDAAAPICYPAFAMRRISFSYIPILFSRMPLSNISVFTAHERVLPS
jgi:hypothetical protein